VRSQRWDERGGKDYDVKETNSYPEDFTLTLADMLEFKLSPVVSKTGKGSGPTNLLSNTATLTPGRNYEWGTRKPGRRGETARRGSLRDARKDILFTSGATQSNNMIIKALVQRSSTLQRGSISSADGCSSSVVWRV
jgi:hypothetical protein